MTNRFSSTPFVASLRQWLWGTSHCLEIWGERRRFCISHEKWWFLVKKYFSKMKTYISKQTIARTAFTHPAIDIEWIANRNVLNRPPPWSSLGEQFLRFSKNNLSWFNRIFLLFDARKSCVFPIFLLRSIKAYLCPNINFGSMDFSERRPEEVTSFFWRSVYLPLFYSESIYERIHFSSFFIEKISKILPNFCLHD